MKKILSAVFVMAMLIITATITGSVLAAEPYVFDPKAEDLADYPVIYLDEANGTLKGTDDIAKSTDSTNAYRSMSDAVGALVTAKTEGYIILVSDYTLNTSVAANNVFGIASTGHFPKHEKMVILRGMTRENGTKSKMYLGGMPYAQGPLWLQNLDFVCISKNDTCIAMHGYDFGWGTPGGDASDISFSRAAAANGVTPTTPSILVGGDGGGPYDRSPVLNFYSGVFKLELKLSGAYGKTTLNGDVTINNYGCEMSGSITNGHGLPDQNNGNININIYGGKWSGSPKLVTNGEYYSGSLISTSYVTGNVNVTISGSPDLTGLQKVNISRYAKVPTTENDYSSALVDSGLVGTAVLDMTGYTGADKATVISRIGGSFDAALCNSVFVSASGNDDNAGTADAPVATYAKAVELLGAEGGVMTVQGAFTLDSYAESERTALVVITGDTLVVNGDFELGGTTMFMDVDIKNGTNGAIVAGGNALSVMADVKTSTGAGGKYIDLIAGKRGELVPVDITVKAGTYNMIDPAGLADGSNIEIASGVRTIVSGVRADNEISALVLANGTITNASIEDEEPIDFVDDQQAIKICPESDGIASIVYTGEFDGTVYNFGSFEYYLNLKDTDTVTVTPQLVINGVTYTAEQTATNGWNVASFDLSDVDAVFNEFTFYPYGQNVVAEYNKMYVFSFRFSQLKSNVAHDYGEIEITENGDYIPVLEDFILTSTELVNTKAITGLKVEDVIFVAGSATKYTPVDTTGLKADYNVLEDGNVISLKGEFYPYVRIEYYVYGKDEDDFGTVYPTLLIGDNTYKANEKLEFNKWCVATFNVVDAGKYNQFSFVPYGEAEGVNEWNKMYVQKMSFSQAENKALPEYSKPDMTDDGELTPYVYENTDGLPVVYYAKGGIYTGDYTGSTDSTQAYGSVDAAVSAIDAAGGGYVILCDDWRVADNRYLPKHTNMVIFRGKEKESNEGKIKFEAFYQTYANGPTTFENLIISWIRNPVAGGSNADLALICYDSTKNHKLVMGKYGVENDVEIVKYTGQFLDLIGADITINSGKFGIRLGTYGSNKTFDAVNITLNGGTLNHIIATFNHNGTNVSQTTVNGDINININGGNFSNYEISLVNGIRGFRGLETPGKLICKGKINYNISGGDFSAVGSKIVPYVIVPEYPSECAGPITLNLLDYTGNIKELRAKFDESRFDVLNVNAIYLDDNGDDSNDGLSADSAVATFEKAYELLTTGDDPTKTYSGKIVVSGSGYTVRGEVVEPEHASVITYNCEGDAAIKFESGKLILSGDADFKNVKFSVTNADSAAIVANGHKLNIADTVTCSNESGAPYLDIVGGKESGTVDSVDVTINGGDFGNVIAGDSVTGDVNITVNGGTIHGKLVGGTSADNGVIGGNSVITINGGTIDGEVIGGNEAAGTIEGMVSISLNGGTFTSGASIIASNTDAGATVDGNAEITVNGGDFSAMEADSIQPGIGSCNDKICIDYRNYNGNISNISSKIEDKFDVTIAPPEPKPTFSSKDKVVHIIANYGDPTKALKVNVPFKITQTATQIGDPIVVSPKQLNLKVDRADHINMTLQTVKDTVDTIRLVPNHNPTRGSGIVIDGYNINGRGVDVSTHKYIEIVYYYTVPQGESPAVQNMAIQYLGNFAGKISGTSADLVPNKWTTALIDLSSVSEGLSGALQQYHFYPMGMDKKGTDVPVTQYIDIASMTFYTNMPKTTVQGGNAPDPKLEAEEEKETQANNNPAKAENIVVDVVDLTSVVGNSGAFTAAQVTKDGMTVMEYTPNTESNKELRIEGYNCMGREISLNEYQYLTLKIFVETERTDVTFIPAIGVQRGGVADNPEAVKASTITAGTALTPNKWTTVTFKLTPADPAFHITRQFHIAPVGIIKGNAMKAGEKFYLAEFVLSAKPPRTAASEDDEVYVEAEVIEEAPAVVVGAAKLINSAGSSATFKSSVEVFDGKQVVKIAPSNVSAPVSVDGTAIFGDTEQTPDGALSLRNHRYAIISYYYATEDTNAERIPEFTLLGGRIQDKGNVVNSVVAKGTAALKKNEWATAVVKLSGNGEGILTSGFTLRPFGNTAATNLANGDILYIENITFVSNRP